MLSSPEGAWTDFHVDFGGSLVWYHVLEGAKTFLAIPPSEAALTAFEKWASSPKQVHARLYTNVEQLCIVCRKTSSLWDPLGFYRLVMYEHQDVKDWASVCLEGHMAVDSTWTDQAA